MRAMLFRKRVLGGAYVVDLRAPATPEYERGIAAAAVRSAVVLLTFYEVHASEAYLHCRERQQKSIASVLFFSFTV